MGDIWGKLWTRYIRILFTLLKSFVLEAVRGFFFLLLREFIAWHVAAEYVIPN